MSSETLLRAYRLAVQRETQIWALAPGWTGSWVPDYVLTHWARCQVKQERYVRLQRRIEARLLERLGAARA